MERTAAYQRRGHTIFIFSERWQSARVRWHDTERESIGRIGRPVSPRCADERTSDFLSLSLHYAKGPFCAQLLFLSAHRAAMLIRI